MSGQGRGEKAWLGDNCYVARGKEEGRSGRRERSLCLSPVPGDCEPAHRDHAEVRGGEGRRQLHNKTACSTASSHLSKSTTGDWGNPDPESSSLMTWRGVATCQDIQMNRDITIGTHSFSTDTMSGGCSLHCWG